MVHKVNTDNIKHKNFKNQEGASIDVLDGMYLYYLRIPFYLPAEYQRYSSSRHVTVKLNLNAIGVEFYLTVKGL